MPGCKNRILTVQQDNAKPVTGLPIAEFLNALVAFLFATTAPVAIILSVSLNGGLSEIDIASWIFAVFAINGVLSIAMSVSYRQPLVFLWTIPGAILVGQALDTIRFTEVIGAYLLTGLLLLFLGLTGWIKKVMDWLPQPIVMGMVAGAFVNFGLDWIRAFADDFLLVASMSVVFFGLSALPRLPTGVPPLIWALIVGTWLILYRSGTSFADLDLSLTLAAPRSYVPEFTLAATMELVLPLAITVVALQNAQGIAVLKPAGHNPPVNAITTWCGFMSILTALYGGISTCLTGPVNAILVASGDPRRHWIAASMLGVMVILFGLCAPTVTSWLIAAPTAFLSTLAGLALLRTLQTAFQSAFGPTFPLGGLIAFLVTFGGIPMLNIGAPFWGLVFGVLASLLLERQAFTGNNR
jgi:benzoate membrane transport protein